MYLFLCWEGHGYVIYTSGWSIATASAPKSRSRSAHGLQEGVVAHHIHEAQVLHLLTNPRKAGQHSSVLFIWFLLDNRNISQLALLVKVQPTAMFQPGQSLNVPSSGPMLKVEERLGEELPKGLHFSYIYFRDENSYSAILHGNASASPLVSKTRTANSTWCWGKWIQQLAISTPPPGHCNALAWRLDMEDVYIYIV